MRARLFLLPPFPNSSCLIERLGLVDRSLGPLASACVVERVVRVGTEPLAGVGTVRDLDTDVLTLDLLGRDGAESGISCSAEVAAEGASSGIFSTWFSEDVSRLLGSLVHGVAELLI